MRVSSTVYPSSIPQPGGADAPKPAPQAQTGTPTAFAPFGAEAFALAHRRHVPVFLLIGEPDEGFADAAAAWAAFK